jgi:hypothetical protein
MKRDNDYLELLPYREIGSSSAKTSPLTPVVRAVAIAVVFIGLPSLAIVPLMTYFFQGYTRWQTFLLGVAGNFVIPAAAIAAIALLASLATLFGQRR